jgi:branched-chain amino acid transport system permease protein
MRESIVAALKEHWPAIGLSLLLVALAGITWEFGDRLLRRSAAEALIYVVIVVGIYIFMGNSGVMSFGSIAFAAIGAYASAWQTCCPGIKPMLMTGLPDFLRLNTFPNFIAAVTSGLLAAAVAFVVGIPIMRLSGIPASIGTLALLAIVNTIYSNWGTVTLGTRSIVGLPLYVDMWVALGWAIGVIIAAFAYQRSGLGIALRATREDEVAARASGIWVGTQRLFAWTLSAFFVGVGGVLYGHFVGVLTVAGFYLEMTFITLAMLVVGGTRSLTGAVTGVLVLSGMIELLRRLEGGIHIGPYDLRIPSGLQEIALGILMLLMLIFRPHGLSGGRELPWPWKRSANTKLDPKAAKRAPHIVNRDCRLS